MKTYLITSIRLFGICFIAVGIFVPINTLLDYIEGFIRHIVNPRSGGYRTFDSYGYSELLGELAPALVGILLFALSPRLAAAISPEQSVPAMNPRKVVFMVIRLSMVLVSSFIVLEFFGVIFSNLYLLDPQAQRFVGGFELASMTARCFIYFGVASATWFSAERLARVITPDDANRV